MQSTSEYYLFGHPRASLGKKSLGRSLVVLDPTPSPCAGVSRVEVEKSVFQSLKPNMHLLLGIAMTLSGWSRCRSLLSTAESSHPLSLAFSNTNLLLLSVAITLSNCNSPSITAFHSRILSSSLWSFSRRRICRAVNLRIQGICVQVQSFELTRLANSRIYVPIRNCTCK